MAPVAKRTAAVRRRRRKDSPVTVMTTGRRPAQLRVSRTAMAKIEFDRRVQPRPTADRWQSSLTEIEPNKILLRGYPLAAMMGRLGLAEAVYLLLRGELPTPASGRMPNAVLVRSVDHGVTPPSTLAARNVATAGAPLKDCVAAGILAFGPHHGGDIESCMHFLDSGLTLIRGGKTMQQAADAIVRECVERHEVPPGFGHRYHTRDP